MQHVLGTALRRGPRGVSGLLLGLAGFFLLASAAAGVARYRLSAVPFYLPFVAAGWLWIARRVTAGPTATAQDAGQGDVAAG